MYEHAHASHIMMSAESTPQLLPLGLAWSGQRQAVESSLSMTTRTNIAASNDARDLPEGETR